MRPFSAPPPAPAPVSGRHDAASRSRASTEYDEAVPEERSNDEPTEEHWRVTMTDIYGNQFTHHLQPVPEVYSSGQPVEVCMSTFA